MELKDILRIMKIDFWSKHLKTKCVLPTLSHTTFDGLEAHDSKYFAVSIQDRIQKTMKKESYASFSFDGFDVSFTFIHKSTPKYMIEFYLFLFVKVLQGLATVSPLRRHMHMHLIDTPVPKKYSKTSPQLTNKEVNSGVTIKHLDVNECYVYIYRREEMIKVLIHELIHALDIDHSSLNPHLETQLKQFFGVANNSLFVNETFTDTLACYINTMIYSVFESMCIEQSTPIHRRFKHHLQNETKHILSQARRILDLYGSFNERGYWEPREQVHEKTHAVAYYVLKGATFSSLDLWKAYMESQNWQFRSEQGFLNLLESIVLDRSSVFWKKMLVTKYDGTTSLRMSSLDISKLVYAHRSKLLKTLKTG